LHLLKPLLLLSGFGGRLLRSLLAGQLGLPLLLDEGGSLSCLLAGKLSGSGFLLPAFLLGGLLTRQFFFFAGKLRCGGSSCSLLTSQFLGSLASLQLCGLLAS
jgi:hypothetical protein